MAGKTRKPIRNAILSTLGKLLLFIGRWLPWGAVHFLGGLVGSLTFRFSRREREKALNSLQIAYGEEKSDAEIEELARASFRNMGRILFEMLKLPGLNRKSLEERVKIENLELLQQPQEQGRGVIITTGHIGNWEIMGAAAVNRGIKLHVIAREIHISGFNKLIIKLRKRMGIETIVRNSEASAKKILSALRRHEVLAMLIDQDIAAEGDFVPFFGREALTPTGPARLALKTDSAMIAAACHRTGKGRFTVHLQPVEFNRGLGEDEAVVDATARATEILEGWIREKPDQWPWIHQRWKSQRETESIQTPR